VTTSDPEHSGRKRWGGGKFRLIHISHTLSSGDAARTCSGEARTGFSEGLYGNMPPKDNSVRNEAGAGRSKSQ